MVRIEQLNNRTGSKVDLSDNEIESIEALKSLTK